MSIKPLFSTTMLALSAALLTACGGGDAPTADASLPRVAAVASARAGATAPLLVHGGLRERSIVEVSGSEVTLKPNPLPGQANLPIVTVITGMRVRFDDLTLDVNPDGATAQIYRLYQAAFNRVPDIDGLSYWTAALDRGVRLDDIAAGLFASDESRALYGAAPAPEDLVARLYRNVLHREPDAAGVAYWVAALRQGTVSAAQVLTGFSDSRENHDATDGAVRSGIAFYETGVTYLPVARIGATPTELQLGGAITLDGAASTSPGPLSYVWAVTTRPAGSSAQLQNNFGPKPTLTPDVAGNYVVSLMVGNNTTQSSFVSVQFKARGNASAWAPAAGVVPAAGNIVYLEGAAGDPILGNRSVLYREADSTLSVGATGRHVSVAVRGAQNWNGEFVSSNNAALLAPGYYDDMTLYPYLIGYNGGMSWSGDGVGCTILSGWFYVDKVSYTGTTLTAIDMRFEQRCNGQAGVLHGQIRWSAPGTAL